MRVDVDIKGLDGVLDTLRSLPPELVSRRGGPVLAALRKGAKVIDAQRRANLQAVTANATDAETRESTGFLLKNLAVTRGKVPIDGKGERVLLRVRRKAYPGRQGATTLAAAQLLEYGSSHQPAEPWIRPAFQSRAREAIETTERELLAGIDRVVKKLARQNRRK
jgi:HK97 gp10 family phage protein